MSPKISRVFQVPAPFWAPRICWVALAGLLLAVGAPASVADEAATKIGGKSAEEWVSALSSDESRTRAEAALALRLLGPSARSTVPALIEALDHPKADVQIKAAEALGEIGPDALPAAPALVRMLGVRESGVGNRHWATEALAAIGPSALPHLVKCVEGNKREARVRAEGILARFGPAAKGAAVALARRVNRRDQDEATHALHALRRIGPGASAAVPALLDTYESLKPDDLYPRRPARSPRRDRCPAEPSHHQATEGPRPGTPRGCDPPPELFPDRASPGHCQPGDVARRSFAHRATDRNDHTRGDRSDQSSCPDGPGRRAGLQRYRCPPGCHPRGHGASVRKVGA